MRGRPLRRRGPTAGRPAGSAGPALLAVLALVVAGSLAGCGPGSDGTGTGTGSGGHRLTRVLSYDFENAPAALDEGARIKSSIDGGPTATVHLAGTAPRPLSLVSGVGGRGEAVAFPRACRTRPATCPKSIIEVDPDLTLDPGPGDAVWGATIKLTHDETSKGSNVVQKGFSLGGESQWKLQIDGVAGRPSCVVVGKDDPEIYEAKSPRTVSDGRWHVVSCSRAGDGLIITVDGKERSRTTLPHRLLITPPGPVRIGGKSLKPDNDQFFGSVDDVFLEVAR